MPNTGMFDMNGNVWEWNESTFDGILDNMAESRAIRGGAFNSIEGNLHSSNRTALNPFFEFDDLRLRNRVHFSPFF